MTDNSSTLVASSSSYYSYSSFFWSTLKFKDYWTAGMDSFNDSRISVLAAMLAYKELIKVTSLEILSSVLSSSVSKSETNYSKSAILTYSAV